MRIAYNPKTAAALSQAPANNDITFDLSGLSIYVRGVRFKGTDTTYSVFKKHDENGGGYDGLVPVPDYNNGLFNRFLREDGTWQYIAGSSDINVYQSEDDTSDFRPVILGLTHSANLTELVDPVTGLVYVTAKIYACPSTGVLYATKLFSNGKEVLTEHQSLEDYVTLSTPQTIIGRKTFYTLVDISNGDKNADDSLYKRPIIYMDASKNMIYSDPKAHTIIRGSAIRLQTSNDIDTVNILPDTVKTIAKIVSDSTIQGTLFISTIEDAAPLVVNSASLVAKLNSDLLDGYHANGLFEKLDNDGNNLSITIGGTKKNLIVNYATQSGKLGYSIKFKNISYLDVTFDGSKDIDLTGGIYYSLNSDYAKLLKINSTSTSTIATSVGTWAPVSGKEYVFRQKWTNSAVGSDTADLAIYLDRNLTANMCLDGYYYSLSGFKKSGSDDNYVLLGGGGHKTISSIITSGYIGTTLVLTSSNIQRITGINGIHLVENSGISFRESHSGYYTTLRYDTYGNEALILGMKNAVTSFIVKSGDSGTTNNTTTTFNSLTPSILVKGLSLYVNSLISNDTTPGYNFFVSGTSKFTNTVRISTTTGNFCEGIRLQCSDGLWLTIILGSTAETGTNTYAWSIHRKSDNNFCISRNSSDGSNGLVMTPTGMGLSTTSPAYRLHVVGDTYATGWSRADNGFYCENTGVHFTHLGTLGEIDMTSNNEFLWGSSGSTLYFNYRGVSRGATVTNYIWNAGSPTSYASHTLGALTSRGDLTLYGLTSTCNKGNSTSYMQSALQIREYNFGGAQSDTWAIAPRLSWHWSGRVLTQIGLASNNELYLSKDEFSHAYKLVYETGTWGININGNATSANYIYTGYISNLNVPSSWNSDGARLVYDTYSNSASNKPISYDNANAIITLFKTKHGTSSLYVSLLSFPDNGRIYSRYAAAGSFLSWNTIAYTSDIPTVTNYYWANIKVSASSSTTTYPTFGSLSVVNDSCNNSTDALAYFQHRSNNDWTVKIDSGSYDYGLYINASGNYALSVGPGASRFRGSVIVGADASPSYTLDVRGTTRSTNRIYANEWIQFDNFTGLYSPNNGAHFYPNNTTSYGQWQLRGNRNGYSGIHFGDSTHYMTIMDNYSDKGVFQEDWGWLWYFNARNGKFSIRTSSDFGADINLNGSVRTNSTYYGYGLYHLSYGSSNYFLTSDGGARYWPGLYDGRYLRYEGWWSDGSGQNINDSLGMNFTYVSHGAPHHWGTTVTFEASRNSSYRLQLHGTGDNYLFFRNRSADYGGWHSSGWKQILTNQDTYVASDGTNRGIINGAEVASARHLLINGVTWNSNWHWSGQGGQPTWLWGSNNGSDMYVWNPRNFSVNYASSAGTASKLSTNAGSSAKPVYFSGGVPVACGYSFKGLSTQPVVLVSGYFYRNYLNLNTWYFTGYKHSEIGSPSFSVNGGVMTLTFSNTVNVYFISACALSRLNFSGRGNISTTLSASNTEYSWRSEGAYWFNTYVSNSSKTSYLYIRSFRLADRNNDSWGSYASSWKLEEDAIHSVSFTIFGYI